MQFSEKLAVNKENLYRSLGYKTQIPDETIKAEIEIAVSSVEKADSARWIWAKYKLVESEMQLEPIHMRLEGSDIRAHLQNCTETILLAVTLGSKIEQVTRVAEATNMQQAIMVDMAASVLVEQYADKAQELLLQMAQESNEYLTSRYSPGYGDFPIEMQKQVLAVLNAQRAIGLTVNQSGLMIPRKSITAFMGVSNQPVKGKLAGCGNCVLKEKCKGSCLCNS